MSGSLTKVLLKIFAYRFYREQSGLLLFLFVTLISYCLFINTAGIYKSEESTFYHLMLMMTFIITPVIMLLVFSFWLIYTVKSWQYVAAQLQLESNQFLFYGMTSFSKAQQFKSWFCVQLVISLPFLAYWLFATVLGVIYDANVIPAITLVYILFMATVSSFIYIYLVNRINQTKKTALLLRISRKWNKPFSSLFMYHLFDRTKVVYVLTKIASLLVMTGILHIFPNYKQDLRVPYMVMLGIVTLHSVLIFQEYRFKETYLSFARNLPYSRSSLFLNFSFIYFLIILPECIWCFSKFPLPTAVEMLLFGLSTAMLFRSILHLIGLRMYRYLLWVFSLFILSFYIIMFGVPRLSFVASLIISYLLFYQYYYKPKTVIKF
ncbi:hypothetical protein H7F33_17040 [Pedobacter sp. PAMC26386]|nr:hypothetical protein H7F33_17040 [Pedobacter sp. PAMC26386]